MDKTGNEINIYIYINTALVPQKPVMNYIFI